MKHLKMIVFWFGMGLFVQFLVLLGESLVMSGEGGEWFTCLSGPYQLGFVGWLLLFSMRPFLKFKTVAAMSLILFLVIVGYAILVSAGILHNDGYSNLRRGLYDLGRAPLIGFPAVLAFASSSIYFGFILTRSVIELIARGKPFKSAAEYR